MKNGTKEIVISKDVGSVAILVDDRIMLRYPQGDDGNGKVIVVDGWDDYDELTKGIKVDWLGEFQAVGNSCVLGYDCYHKSEIENKEYGQDRIPLEEGDYFVSNQHGRHITFVTRIN